MAVKPKGSRAARTIWLCDQVGAVLRDHPAGLTTPEVYTATGWARPRWPARPAEYLDVYRALRIMEGDGLVYGTRLGAGQAATVLWTWQSLPLRIPGDTLGHLEEEHDD